MWFWKNKKGSGAVLKPGPLTSEGLPTYHIGQGGPYPFIAVLVRGATPKELAKAIRRIEEQNGIAKTSKFVDVRKL